MKTTSSLYYALMGKEVNGPQHWSFLRVFRVSLPTRAAVVALHPNVAVVLGDAGLRIQERQADAALSTQAGIVAATLLNSLLIELVTQSAWSNICNISLTDAAWWRMENLLFTDHHLYSQETRLVSVCWSIESDKCTHLKVFYLSEF